MELTVKQLADKLDAELRSGGDDIAIKNVAPVKTAEKNNITFISDKKHLGSLKASRAGAVITSEYIEGFEGSQLIVKNVEAGLIKVLEIFAPHLKPAKVGIDKTAKVSSSANLADDVSVGAFVNIENNVKIGSAAVIAPGCSIGQNTVIGENCRLDANVAVHHNCKIGNNVVIQSNSVIGSTGFGYAQIDNKAKLIPHNGGVIIEDFVEIGANTCIDRAKFENTIIGAGTKIDNLVQIAHNVVIGKCCLIAGQSGMGGNTKIGNGVVMAGRSGVTDNLTIGDRVIIAARSVVTRNCDSGEVLYGNPAENMKKRQRIEVLVRRLPEYVKQIKQLSEKVKELEAAENDKK
jgi:UDP-3-O-[3-hydroxymyristoyl] glucosamine N-acyltransferase